MKAWSFLLELLKGLFLLNEERIHLERTVYISNTIRVLLFHLAELPDLNAPKKRTLFHIEGHNYIDNLQLLFAQRIFCRENYSHSIIIPGSEMV